MLLRYNEYRQRSDLKNGTNKGCTFARNNVSYTGRLSQLTKMKLRGIYDNYCPENLM